MATMKTLKSECSAKILMGKLDRKYEAARSACSQFEYARRLDGWCDTSFAELKTLEAACAAVVEEMEALEAQAKSQGFYAGGHWLSWWSDPTCALIAANID